MTAVVYAAATHLQPSPPTCWCVSSDVNKDWTCKDKDKDKDLTHEDQDMDKDFTYSYLLQVAAIQLQQWTQSESSQHMTVKPITLNK